MQVDVERLLVERYGVRIIDRDGDEIRCSCPLPFGMHKQGDRHPSFGANIKSRLVNCFVCGGGDMAWFIMSMEGVDRYEAARIAQEYREDAFTMPSIEQRQEEQSSVDVDALLMQVTRWAANDTPYWCSRGIAEETQQAWMLGYAPEMRRAVIPHFVMGRCFGWTARKVDDEPLAPKWIHSPGLPKATTLFGYDRALAEDAAIIVEAPLSAIWLWQCGLRGAVATFGASMSWQQSVLLRRFSRVVLWYDPDDAGRKGTRKAIESLRHHVPVDVVVGAEGDPAECTSERCIEIVRSAVPWVIAWKEA